MKKQSLRDLILEHCDRTKILNEGCPIKAKKMKIAELEQKKRDIDKEIAMAHKDISKLEAEAKKKQMSKDTDEEKDFEDEFEDEEDTDEEEKETKKKSAKKDEDKEEDDEDEEDLKESFKYFKY